MRNKKTLFIIGIIVLCLAIGFFVAFFTHSSKDDKKDNNPIEETDNKKEDNDDKKDEVIENIDDNTNEDNKKEEENKQEETKTDSQTKDKPKSTTPSTPKTDNKIKDLKINESGYHTIKGEHGCVTITATDDVVLDFQNAIIKCSNGPGINIESNVKTRLNLNGSNLIEATTDKDLDGAIYSKGDLYISGTGTLKVKSNYDGIVSKKKITFASGTYSIETSDDGIRGKDGVEINNITITIKVTGDGIKATNDEDNSKGYIKIGSGTFNITSGGDAFDAANYIEINNGTFNIKTGDGYKTKSTNSAKGLKADKKVTINKGTLKFDVADDAIHSNNNVYINAGNITIQTADDAIHGDYNVEVTNGTVNINNCFEGIESHNITIKGGTITIFSTDDGINAVHPELKENDKTGKVLFTGGTTKVLAGGDGIDSNGSIEVKGGTITLESQDRRFQTALDHDTTLKVNGGTLIAISKTIGEDDTGPKESTVPMVVAHIRGGSGYILLGDISYLPYIYDYQVIIIASDELTPGDYQLIYGGNSINLELINGVLTYGTPQIK